MSLLRFLWVAVSVCAFWPLLQPLPAARAQPAERDEVYGGEPTQEQQTQARRVRSGVMVMYVQPSGPATRCRDGNGRQVTLEPGDIITHVGDERIRSMDDYYDLMGGRGEKEITVVNCRGGGSETYTVRPSRGRIGIQFWMVRR